MAHRGGLTGEQIDRLPEMIDQKQDRLVDGQNIKTINGQSILGEGNIVIQGGQGSGVDPELLEGYTPLMREFSDDFNNDFAR